MSRVAFLLELARACSVVIDACSLIAFQHLPSCVLPRVPLGDDASLRSTTPSEPDLSTGKDYTLLSGPGICVCNSSHNSITWRAERRTHLSKKTRPSTEHSRKASYVRGIPSRPDDQLRWVLIARSQV